MRVGSTVTDTSTPATRTPRADPRRVPHAYFGRQHPSEGMRALAAKGCVLPPARRPPRRGPRARRGGLSRREVAQRAVRPGRVVLLLPVLAQHPRLQQAAELLPLQQLVPQLAVERLGV